MRMKRVLLLMVVGWLALPVSGLAFYNPEEGRWLNRDPVGEEGGINQYGFVANEPVASVDPSGNCLFKPSKAACVEFSGCSRDQLRSFRLIPEEKTGSLKVPQSGWNCDVDGLWQRGSEDHWYKIPNHCHVTITWGVGGGVDFDYCCNVACTVLQMFRDEIFRPGWQLDEGDTAIHTDYPWVRLEPRWPAPPRVIIIQ